MIHYFVETYTLEGQWQKLSTTKAVKWLPDKCLPDTEVNVFNLALVAADPREKGLTEWKRKPVANLIPSSLQMLKYTSKPRTRQTSLFEPPLNAKTFASPDLKDLVQILLYKRTWIIGRTQNVRYRNFQQSRSSVSSKKSKVL